MWRMGKTARWLVGGILTVLAVLLAREAWRPPATGLPQARPPTVSELATRATPAVMQIIGYGPGSPENPLPELTRGTGFFLAPEGWLVTARHVLDGCVAARITSADGRQTWSNPQVVAFDRAADLLLLQVAAPPTSALRLAMDEPSVGDPVLLVGFPAETKGSSSRAGRLLERHELPGGTVWLHLDLTLTPGLSGAPVMERAAGRVVGVAALASEAQPQGYAIPAAALAAACEVAAERLPLSLAAWQRREQQRRRWQEFLGDNRFQRAVAQLDNGQAAVALSGFSALLRENGGRDNPWVLLQAARAQEQLGRLAEAQAWCAQAAQAGDEPLAWMELARLARQRGVMTPAEQRKLLRRAVQANPADPLAWFAYGEACQAAGDTAAATHAFRRARRESASR